MILSPLPKLCFLDNAGRPMVGGRLFTYAAGTSTKIDTARNQGGTLNTNPVVLNFRGECDLWLDPALTYDLVLAPPGSDDPPTSTIWTAEDVSALGGSQSVGQVLYPRSDEEVTAGITPTDYTFPPRLFQRYGVVCDGSTDNTSTITTVAAAMGGGFVIPYNCAYNRTTLITNLSSDALLADFSLVNDFNSAGEATKRFGIIAKDAVNDDSQWSVDSGHFATLALNNHGTAGTTSATSRYASLFWAVGAYVLGGAGKQGDRPAAQLVFGKDTGGDYWTMRVESYAPWLAIAANYERFASGQTIVNGDYRVTSAPGVYKAQNGGTTNATEPTVTSGTEVVNGITWEFIDDGQHTIFSLDQYGRVLIGNSAAGNTFLHRPSPADPAGDYTMMLQARGVSKNVFLRMQPTDAAQALDTAIPHIRVQAGVGVRVLDSTVTYEHCRLSDANLFEFKTAFAHMQATITYSASMTPDARAANSQTFTANNGTAFTINAPTNALTGRRLKITARNASGGAMGAATWNAAYKMAAWTNPANGNSRSIEFEYDGANWIEINRTPADVPN